MTLPFVETADGQRIEIPVGIKNRPSIRANLETLCKVFGVKIAQLQWMFERGMVKAGGRYYLERGTILTFRRGRFVPLPEDVTIKKSEWGQYLTQLKLMVWEDYCKKQAKEAAKGMSGWVRTGPQSSP